MRRMDVIERHEVSVARVIDAPRPIAFRAWTDPAMLSRWWGPRGMTTTVCEIDPRPGGFFLTVVRDDAGNEFPAAGIFIEVVENERLVFTGACIDNGPQRERCVTVTEVSFEDEGHRTKVTSTARHWALANREDRDDASVGPIHPPGCP